MDCKETFDKNTRSFIELLIRNIQDLYCHLLKTGTFNVLFENAHKKIRSIREMCSRLGINFNVIIKRIEKFHNADTMAHASKLEEISKKFHDSQNLRDLVVENQKLMTDTKTLEEEGLRFQNTLSRIEAEKQLLQTKIKTLEATVESLKNSATNAETIKPQRKHETPIVHHETSDNETESCDSIDEDSSLGSGISPAYRSRIKLFVFFGSGFYIRNVSNPAVEKRGRYTWSSFSWLKCEISKDLSPGWVSFETMRSILRPLICGEDLREILQLRANINGMDVAEVTSIGNDEAEREPKLKQFCNTNGLGFSWNAAGQPQWEQRIHPKGKIFICGGRRRTVLWIWS